MLVQSFTSVFELVGVPRLPRANPPRNPKINSSYISVGDPSAGHDHPAISDPDGHFALHPDPLNKRSWQTLSRGENATGADVEQRLRLLKVEVNNCRRRATTTAFL